MATVAMGGSIDLVVIVQAWCTCAVHPVAIQLKAVVTQTRLRGCARRHIHVQHAKLLAGVVGRARSIFIHCLRREEREH